MIVGLFKLLDKHLDNDKREPETFARTKLIWDVLKVLFWPLHFLWWLIVMVAYTEWCVPAWKWFRANKNKEKSKKWWCTRVGANAWTLVRDVCCFRKYRATSRGVADVESQRGLELTEGLVKDQPLTSAQTMEGLPTYNQATGR